MSPKVRVANEIGRLRRVLVHTPGKEVTAVTPSTRKEFLYDDIISLEAAAEEHRRFTSILRRFAQVDEFIDVLSETLDIPEARKFLIDRSEEITACVSLRKKIEELSSREIAHLYIEGWRTEPGPFATALEAQSYVLPPLPNLYFMRDASFVLGNHPVISATRFTARWPEEALMRTLFGFHPELGSQPILYDGSVERRHDYTIEGGDIHPVSPDTVVVGLSERTSVSALDVLSKRLFEETEVTEIIAVMIPEHSPAIHLDMVWTQVDTDLAVIYPPYFRGPTRLPVLHQRKNKQVVGESASLLDALGDVGMKMDAIYCGGNKRDVQEREQWASGCNFFAVAPGQVLAYSRNEATLRSMQDAGFRIVDSTALLLGDENIKENEKVVIAFAGAELVRGGGGPRCMTCPVLRDDI